MQAPVIQKRRPNTGTGQLDNDVTMIRGGGHGKEDLE